MSETSKEIPEIIYPFVSVSQRAREASGKPSLLEHTSTACRQRFRASSGVWSHTLKQCRCRTEPRRALIPEAPRQALPTCTRREGQPDTRHHGRRHPGRGLRAGRTVGSGLGTSRTGHGDGGRRWRRHRPCRTAEPPQGISPPLSPPLQGRGERRPCTSQKIRLQKSQMTFNRAVCL